MEVIWNPSVLGTASHHAGCMFPSYSGVSAQEQKVVHCAANSNQCRHESFCISCCSLYVCDARPLLPPRLLTQLIPGRPCCPLEVPDQGAEYGVVLTLCIFRIYSIGCHNYSVPFFAQEKPTPGRFGPYPALWDSKAPAGSATNAGQAVGATLRGPTP